MRAPCVARFPNLQEEWPGHGAAMRGEVRSQYMNRVGTRFCMPPTGRSYVGKKQSNRHTSHTLTLLKLQPKVVDAPVSDIPQGLSYLPLMLVMETFTVAVWQQLMRQVPSTLVAHIFLKPAMKEALVHILRQMKIWKQGESLENTMTSRTCLPSVAPSHPSVTYHHHRQPLPSLQH